MCGTFYCSQDALSRKEPCILDLCVKNSRDYEQGGPDLVSRDLHAGIVPVAVEQYVREMMHQHGVYDSFELRAELINYKKALYHLYREGMEVEKDLRQLSALLHCSLSSPASNTRAPADQDAQELSGSGGQVSQDAAAGVDAGQRAKYQLLCETLMECKGTVLALQVLSLLALYWCKNTNTDA